MLSIAFNFLRSISRKVGNNHELVQAPSLYMNGVNESKNVCKTKYVDQYKE